MTGFREQEGVQLLQLLCDHPTVIAVDTESTGLKVATEDHCIGVSLAAVVDGQAYSHYFPIAHSVGDNVAEDTVALLAEALGRAGVTLVYANALFDIMSLATAGIDLADQEFIDVQVMAHLVNENFPTQKQGGKQLDSLARYYLGATKKSTPHLDKEKKTGWRNTSPEQIWEYATVDAQLAYRIWLALKDDPEWLALPDEVKEVKWDLIRGPLLVMKQRGVRIDQELAREYVNRGAKRCAEILKELGYENLGPKAMEDLFIVRLGLPIVKTTPKGKPCFDKEAMAKYDDLLDAMAIEDSTVALVKEYRGWQKAVSAAYKAYLDHVDIDGRLRCSYKLHGTVTGRLSCVEPNLQQIPKSSDKAWNGKVKDCIIPDDGFVLVNADFSQLELRLGTAYADEPALRQVFEEGRDIFTEMAGALGWSRHDTKTFVYSTQYGAGPDRIMSAFGVDEDQAGRMRQTYRKTYPRFVRRAEDCKEKVEQDREIALWTGRKRHFLSKNDGYKAWNSVIQGGGADIVERIMLACFRQIDNDDCRMLLQVHDSITWEVRIDKVEEYMARIKAVMEDVNAVTGDVFFDVKFAVDVTYWTEQEERRVAQTVAA